MVGRVRQMCMDVQGGVWRSRMENGGAAQGFLNSIRGSTKFWLILCLYSPRVKQIRVRLSRFYGLGPQNSAIGDQIHLGRGLALLVSYKDLYNPNPQRIRPNKSESKRKKVQEIRPKLGLLETRCFVVDFGFSRRDKRGKGAAPFQGQIRLLEIMFLGPLAAGIKVEQDQAKIG